MARVSAIKVRLLIENPNMYITAKVSSNDSGNATVAWTEFFENLPGSVVMSKRFDTGAGTWGAPVLLNANGGGAQFVFTLPVHRP